MTVTNETESKKKKKEADNDETTEDTDYSTGQKEEDAIQPLEVSSERIAEKHRNKVIAIFEKYRDVLATKLQNDSSVIDINDLTMYLIHLHILLDVVEKEIRYVTRTKQESTVLLQSAGSLKRFNNFSLITYDLIGLFMLLIRNGSISSYQEGTYLQEKNKAYQQKAFEYSFICLYYMHENIQDGKEMEIALRDDLLKKNIQRREKSTSSTIHGTRSKTRYLLTNMWLKQKSVLSRVVRKKTRTYKDTAHITTH